MVSAEDTDALLGQARSHCCFSLQKAAPGVLEVIESSLQQIHNLGLCW